MCWPVATLKRGELVFWTPRFSFFDSTLFRLDSTFWLDSTLKLYYDLETCRDHVSATRFASTSSACGFTFSVGDTLRTNHSYIYYRLKAGEMNRTVTSNLLMNVELLCECDHCYCFQLSLYRLHHVCPSVCPVPAITQE